MPLAMCKECWGTGDHSHRCPNIQRDRDGRHCSRCMSYGVESGLCDLCKLEAASEERIAAREIELDRQRAAERRPLGWTEECDLDNATGYRARLARRGWSDPDA